MFKSSLLLALGLFIAVTATAEPQIWANEFPDLFKYSVGTPQKPGTAFMVVYDLETGKYLVGISAGGYNDADRFGIPADCKGTPIAEENTLNARGGHNQLAMEGARRGMWAWDTKDVPTTKRSQLRGLTIWMTDDLRIYLNSRSGVQRMIAVAGLSSEQQALMGLTRENTARMSPDEVRQVQREVLNQLNPPDRPVKIFRSVFKSTPMLPKDGVSQGEAIQIADPLRIAGGEALPGEVPPPQVVPAADLPATGAPAPDTVPAPVAEAPAAVPDADIFDFRPPEAKNKIIWLPPGDPETLTDRVLGAADQLGATANGFVEEFSKANGGPAIGMQTLMLISMANQVIEFALKEMQRQENMLKRDNAERFEAAFAEWRKGTHKVCVEGVLQDSPNDPYYGSENARVQYEIIGRPLLVAYLEKKMHDGEKQIGIWENEARDAEETWTATHAELEARVAKIMNENFEDLRQEEIRNAGKKGPTWEALGEALREIKALKFLRDRVHRLTFEMAMLQLKARFTEDVHWFPPVWFVTLKYDYGIPVAPHNLTPTAFRYLTALETQPDGRLLRQPDGSVRRWVYPLWLHTGGARGYRIEWNEWLKQKEADATTRGITFTVEDSLRDSGWYDLPLPTEGSDAAGLAVTGGLAGAVPQQCRVPSLPVAGPQPAPATSSGSVPSTPTQADRIHAEIRQALDLVGDGGMLQICASGANFCDMLVQRELTTAVDCRKIVQERLDFVTNDVIRFHLDIDRLDRSWTDFWDMLLTAKTKTVLDGCRANLSQVPAAAPAPMPSAP